MYPHLEEENQRLRNENNRLRKEIASIHVSLDLLTKLVASINEVTSHGHGNSTEETED